MKERGRLEERESMKKKRNAMGREGKKVDAEEELGGGGGEEGEREGRYNRKAGKEQLH